MRGWEQRVEPCGRKSFGQHMQATTKRTVASCDSSITADSFCKEDRKICVGDCALFKPPHDSPPFIGIIRCLIPNEGNNLHLGVNWLYRPAELKLGKGIPSEASPNEVFYSFHRDEISAASLLHPCKVAFLPKGVELPTGISSFVCRRVYDIANKCLCWLTDQDYIDELQEEVGQLLHKTQVEMHTSLQPGGRSPKPVNSSMPTLQSKSGSENVQNTATSFPSQGKGKKRERGDDNNSVKRERSFKLDDTSNLYKNENAIKSEIVKITERGGGLVDSDGVDKLIQFMQADKGGERKMDSVCRSLLAGVVASTDRFECLNRFVQLRGLLVLDEWLQDIHKGSRISDGNQKDGGDKRWDELLLVLLRALDKLPVNLEALKMCNIGKSVNHLRSHKNMDIQKKARSLVDTWKKRVEVEMNMIDANNKSTQGISWPSKSRIQETSHSVNKSNPGFSNDFTPKSSVTTQLSSRTVSVKTLQVETTTAKSASSSPVPVKDGQARVSSLCGGASHVDVPPVVLMREDKSSSSSQSHNHSPSFSGKEDARSSTAGSMSSNKVSNSSSRHRKIINGFPGTSLPGGLKERSKHSNPERVSQSVVVGDNPTDLSGVERGDQKVIAKIPNNRIQSPAHSVSGGSCEEEPNIVNSQASSPVVLEKHVQPDRNVKANSDDLCRSNNNNNIISDVNAESWQSNDLKDILTGSDEGDGSPTQLAEDEREDDRKGGGVSKTVPSSAGKNHNVCFDSMNVLIESCIKYSESNASMSVGDAGGMNLLASVATEQMSKSDLYSPSVSSQRNSPVVEETCMDAADFKSQPRPCERITSDCKQRHGNKQQHVDAGKSLGECNLEMIENDGESDKRSFEGGNKGVYSGAKMGTDTLLEGNNVSLGDQKGSGEEGKSNAAATSDSEVNERLPVKEEHPTSSSRDVSADKGGDEDEIHSYLKLCEKMKSKHKMLDPLLEDKNSINVDSIFNSDNNNNNNLTTECSNDVLAEDKHDCGGSPPSVKERAGYSVTETASKMKFDLNEGFVSDDGKCGEAISPPTHVVNPLPFPITSVPITAKGPFVPPEELLKFKRQSGEFRWKGSAATSAFRPAEPRKVFTSTVSASHSAEAAPSSAIKTRPCLEIDLNAPGESSLEDDEVGYSAPLEIISHLPTNQKKEEPSSPSIPSGGGGLNLDLNRVDDESNDVGQCSLRSGIFNSNILEGPVEPLQSQCAPSREVRMDFDLNNGPTADDITVEQQPFLFQQNSRGNIRMNNPEIGSFASWFTPVCGYSAVSGPPPQQSLASSPFPLDIYQGSVLSSSPAAAYQIPMFPFGTTSFPLPSTSFPVGSAPYINSSPGGRLFTAAVNSQLQGPVVSASSAHQFPRPYMVTLPDNGTSGNNGKWAKQSLDLNAGPGYIDIIHGGRDESLMTSRQLSIAHDQQLLQSAGEHHALYQHPVAAGNIMKRKEPDGGWGDNDSFRHNKQSSWH
ncbi:unnamed protein product [Cuscuta europaea]|uniref:TFIIS N-terminal domain-containing protein n=1 Tax=Cuscuta europaea TaxID=41803 RepID=A0A9P1EAN9_CUSEU|nr:unnamed protein product [Cuscuta europaea]